MDLIVDQQGDVEINDTLHCEIMIWDVYGNQTNDNWELWTVGSNDTLFPMKMSPSLLKENIRYMLPSKTQI